LTLPPPPQSTGWQVILPRSLVGKRVICITKYTPMLFHFPFPRTVFPFFPPPPAPPTCSPQILILPLPRSSQRLRILGTRAGMTPYLPSIPFSLSFFPDDTCCPFFPPQHSESACTFFCRESRSSPHPSPSQHFSPPQQQYPSLLISPSVPLRKVRPLLAVYVSSRPQPQRPFHLPPALASSRPFPRLMPYHPPLIPFWLHQFPQTLVNHQEFCLPSPSDKAVIFFCSFLP